MEQERWPLWCGTVSNVDASVPLSNNDDVSGGLVVLIDSKLPDDKWCGLWPIVVAGITMAMLGLILMVIKLLTE